MRTRILTLALVGLIGFSPSYTAGDFDKIKEGFDRDELRHRLETARTNRKALTIASEILDAKKRQEEERKIEEDQAILGFAKSMRAKRISVDESQLQMADTSNECRSDFSSALTTANELSGLTNFLVKKVEETKKSGAKDREARRKEQLAKDIQDFVQTLKGEGKSDVFGDEEFGKDLEKLLDPKNKDFKSHAESAIQRHNEAAGDKLAYVAELMQAAEKSEEEEAEQEKATSLAEKVGAKAPEFLAGVKKRVKTAADELKAKCEKKESQAERELQWNSASWLLGLAQSTGQSPFETMQANQDFNTKVKGKCAGDLGKIQGGFKASEDALQRIQNSEDFLTLLTSYQDFWHGITTGIANIMPYTASTVRACERAVQAANTWCQDNQRMGKPCQQDGQSGGNTQLASALPSGQAPQGMQSGQGGASGGGQNALSNPLILQQLFLNNK